jgi:mRNA-degrading endonuclease RelE of RelBE toxin-antitoxin system
MTFKPLLPGHFHKQFKKLTKKDAALGQRLGKKIKAICENPEIGEPKSHNLKGLRGDHVDPFVIIYGVFGDFVVFVHVDHHDNAYAAAHEIAKALIDDEGLLATLAKVGVTTEEMAAFVKSIGRRTTR